MPYKPNTWKAFSYVPQNQMAVITGAAYSSLSKWKTSRIERVRFLELGSLLDFYNEYSRNELLSDNQLELPDLLKKMGMKNPLIKDIADLLGESRSTLYSWWTKQGIKKKRQLLLQLEGLFCVFVICKYHKMRDLNIATEEEQKASEQCEFSQELIERISFSAFVKII